MTAKTFRQFRRLGTAWALAAAALAGASNVAAQEASAPLVHPQTTYSQHTQALVREFNAAKEAPPIVMMDRDLFALNLALRHIDPYDPPARAKVIAELAKEQTGLSIDPKHFEMATYQMTGEQPSTWAPFYGPSIGAPGEGFCTVFGQDPDADGPSQLRSLTNLNGVFEPLGARLLNPLSRASINGYTDYHEIGHCFYFTPPPAPDAKPDDVHFQLHKHEMFGDIFSSLLMARDGMTDFAGRYARVRLVASALAGIGDEYHHATWDGLEAAQREIDARGPSGMKEMTLKEIHALSLRLMEENAIDMKTMNIVDAFQQSQYDEAALKALVAKDPSLAKSADYALRLKARMTAALEQSADLKGLGPAGLKPPELVHYYKTHDEEAPDAPEIVSYQQLTVQLRDELLAAAQTKGAPTATSLGAAIDARMESLRRTLDDGDDAARHLAMRRLPLLEKAFVQALAMIDPPKPAPKPGI